MHGIAFTDHGTKKLSWIKSGNKSVVDNEVKTKADKTKAVRQRLVKPEEKYQIPIPVIPIMKVGDSALCLNTIIQSKIMDSTANRKLY